MDEDIEKADSHVDVADVTAHDFIRYEVGEAKQAVSQNKDGALVHDLHPVGIGRL